MRKFYAYVVVVFTVCCFLKAHADTSDTLVLKTFDTFKSSLNARDIDTFHKSEDVLRKLGGKAVPLIADRLESPQEDENVKGNLLVVLSGIGTDNSTRTLIEFACNHPDSPLFGSALGRAQFRDLNFDLNEKCISVLIKKMMESDIYIAVSVANILGRSRNVDNKKRLNPVIARFKQEVYTPTKQPVRLEDCYISPRVYILNMFLLSFSAFGRPAIPYLKVELDASKHEEYSKWLKLGLGMAGDRSVFNDLKNIVDTDPDKSIRCVAIRAFARSGKEQAIPHLEKLLNDKTKSDFGSQHDRQSNYLAEVAQAELFKVKEDMNKLQ